MSRKAWKAPPQDQQKQVDDFVEAAQRQPQIAGDVWIRALSEEASDDVITMVVARLRGGGQVGAVRNYREAALAVLAERRTDRAIRSNEALAQSEKRLRLWLQIASVVVAATGAAAAFL